MHCWLSPKILNSPLSSPTLRPCTHVVDQISTGARAFQIHPWPSKFQMKQINERKKTSLLQVVVPRKWERKKEMHDMWVFLKKNVQCASKVTDVVSWPGRSYTAKKGNLDCELVVHSSATPLREMIFRQSYTRTLLCGLNTGDPSRNIVEMIFQRASMNPSKPLRKIKTVLKVKNSAENVETFEKYREKVKKKAYEQYKRHPRSTVDGNELLRFYGTTIVCCRGKSNRVSELCKNPTCGVCRIIQSNFDTYYTRRNGVQLSTSSEDLIENMIVTTGEENVKRAAIVCRTIAGSTVNMVDGGYQDFDSVGSSQFSNLERLIVLSPNAVLPCFVIVFD